MSKQAQSSPLWQKVETREMEMELNFTDGYDSGTVGIHQSRYSIPEDCDYAVYSTGVGSDPIVGDGASLAIGTDNSSSDPDNIMDTTAVTSLDAENDEVEGAYDGSQSSFIKNATGAAVPVYYNVTDAAITSGKVSTKIILRPRRV